MNFNMALLFFLKLNKFDGRSIIPKKLKYTKILNYEIFIQYFTFGL